MNQIEKTCFMCDSPATSVEHIPPRAIFPEQKDLGKDYRKNLITVPACDKHNLEKSSDDEYLMGIVAFHWRNNQIASRQSITKIKRALARNKRYYDLFFSPGNNQLIFWEEEKLVTTPVSIERFNYSMEVIARGIYFDQFKSKWLRGVQIHPLSLAPIYEKNPDHPIIVSQQRIAQLAKQLCVNQSKRGANPDIFYYQIISNNPSQSVIILMVFYDGFEVLAFFGDNLEGKI